MRLRSRHTEGGGEGKRPEKTVYFFLIVSPLILSLSVVVFVVVVVVAVIDVVVEP